MSRNSEKKQLYLFRAEKGYKKCKICPILQKRGVFCLSRADRPTVRPDCPRCAARNLRKIYYREKIFFSKNVLTVLHQSAILVSSKQTTDGRTARNIEKRCCTTKFFHCTLKNTYFPPRGGRIAYAVRFPTKQRVYADRRGERGNG